MLRDVLLFLHLAGAMVWVGGMVFAYFCLRPAAAQVLEPPQRLTLWARTFGRFFPLVGVAIALILLSGFTLLLQVGFAAAPVGWHAMMTLGLLMSGLYAYIVLVPYTALQRYCEAAAWPAAAATLNRIRQLVALNLVLAALTVAAAVSAR
ncbi:CopD family protein [Ramlibacter sp.]|uniref:CopD family protein n=1 Tax=Ramlibacter sp. TaxID=1917967 RepID=UPI002D4A8AFC|nr:CopD family protein [Ramlibacter sp.]HYD76048.1 CopD family protein [Ramlibacter sp.]